MNRATLRAALGLFLLLQGSLLLLASGRARTVDEHSLHFMAESLAAGRGVEVPQLMAIGSFYGKIGRNGKPYAPYSPGQPFLASFYLRALGPTFAAAATRESGEPLLLAREAASTLLNTTVAAACAALFLMALRVMGVPLTTALGSSLALVAATPLAVYAKSGFSEPLLACFLCGALVGLAWFDSCDGSDPRGLWLAGISAAAAIGVKFAVGGLMAGALVLALIASPARSLRALLRLAVFPLAAGLLHLFWNLERFGSVWDLGYPEAAEMGRRLNDFDTPAALGLFGLLLSPGKGLAFFAPPILVSLAFFPLVRKRSPLAAIASAAFFALCLVLYSKYSAWEGGYCFGPRYLLPAVPGLMLGLPFAMASSRRKAAIVACALGLLVQVPGLLTSFTEDQMAGGRYYDDTYRYRLDYTPAGQWGLAARYAPGLLSGGAWNEPLGLGADFWFVFLVRAGFHRNLIAGWLIVALCLSAAGVILLRRAVLVGGPAPPEH